MKTDDHCDEDLPEAEEEGGDADQDDPEVEEHDELAANMVMMVKMVKVMKVVKMVKMVMIVATAVTIKIERYSGFVSEIMMWIKSP